MLRRSIKARVTAVATAAAVLVLALVGVGAMIAQQRLLTDRVQNTAETRASDVAALYASGSVPAVLGNAAGEGSLAQVIRDGTVVASTANIAGQGPVTTRLPDPGVTRTSRPSDLPVDEGPFLLVVRGADGPGGPAAVAVAESLVPVREARSALISILLVALPLLAAVVAVITWLAVSRALRPIDRARREADEISASGLDRRLTTTDSGDEVARLTHTMNSLLDRIEAGYRREQEFVGDASHELRSPLAAMRSQIEVDLSHPESARPIETERAVLDDIGRLQRLVDSLLVLARSESRANHREPVDVDDVVLRVVDEIDRAGVELDLSGVSGGQVAGSAEELERLVRNLLENAVRHATGRVSIALGDHHGTVRLVVDDDGPGIPPPRRERIFERFGRVESARDRASGGVGLGLAICRRIASRHDGTISVAEAPLGGARFVVDLPSAHDHRSAP